MIKNITPREQELEREVAALRASLNQWLNKTEWVQKTATTKELGMHIADVLKDRVDTLKKRIDNDEQSLYRLHYLMKDHGWHPGRTDDDLIDILDQKIKELKAEIFAAKDSNADKIIAMTDEQITALTRLEGSNPADIAALGRKTLDLALMTVERNKLKAELDALKNQEPVAWIDTDDIAMMNKYGRGGIVWHTKQDGLSQTALYTAPQEPRCKCRNKERWR